MKMIIMLLLAVPLYSQVDTSKIYHDTTDLRSTLQEELLLEEIQSEDEESTLLDFLNELRHNPYDLNKVTLSQLENLPFINSILAKQIIDYRNEIKVFKTKRSLLKVEGISEDLYEKIKIYLRVRQTTRDVLIDETGLVEKEEMILKDKLDLRLSSRLLRELQIRKGFNTGKYQGSVIKIYNRLNAKYINSNFKLEGNVTFEKDAGEKNFNDFTSGFLQLKDFKFIKDMVIGDYVLNFGQGISMWSSQGFSKGSSAVNSVKKKGKGTYGYKSASEVQFFRGGAVKLNYKSIDLNVFYSDNYYDSTIDTVQNGVSSFYFDGYHRTESEIKRKKSVKEKLLGGRVSYKSSSLNFGFTYWKSKFSKLVIPDTIRKLFKFSGLNAGMLSFDYDVIFKSMNFFGEFARSQSNSIAGISGIHITANKFAEIVFSYRHYPKDFVSVHSSGFSERSGETSNEYGFYAGIKLTPFKGLIINSYYDQFKFPYRTFFNPVSTAGNDFVFDADWKVLKGFTCNFRYKNQNKEDTRTITDEHNREVKRIDNKNQLNVRTGFVYELSKNFRLRSRYEYVNIDFKEYGGDSKGTLFYSDIRVTPFSGIVLDLRYILFDTDNYDSRIYEFENDINGVMSNTSMSGNGRRWYVIMKYKPFHQFEISGKYSETYVDGAKSLGSGNDMIKGDVNNKLSLGMEIKF